MIEMPKLEQTQLLDDIEAFSRNGPLPGSEISMPAVGRERLTFPDLNQSVQRQSLTPDSLSQTSSAQPANIAGGSSLLARFKQQAQAVQESMQRRDQSEVARALQLSGGLEVVFHYFDDLVKQLNVVKPPVDKEFVFAGNIVFSSLKWVEGAVDFRLLPAASEDRMYETVTVRLRMAAPHKINVEREALAVEPLRNSLLDHNIAFQLSEKRNERQQAQRASFIIPCEIKAGFVLKADYTAGNLVLRTRNIDRFGTMEFRLRMADIDPEMLEGLTLLILGEENDFLKRFRRSA